MTELSIYRTTCLLEVAKKYRYPFNSGGQVFYYTETALEKFVADMSQKIKETGHISCNNFNKDLLSPFFVSGLYLEKNELRANIIINTLSDVGQDMFENFNNYKFLVNFEKVITLETIHYTEESYTTKIT